MLWLANGTRGLCSPDLKVHTCKWVMRAPSMTLRSALGGACIFLWLASLVGCGASPASSPPPPPPPKDFGITLSPATITADPDSSTSTFTVSVVGQNGFASPVTITLSGLPSGATTSPSAPFSAAAGSTKTVTISVPATVQPGKYTLTVGGTSGVLTHTASLPFTVTVAQDFSINLSATAITAGPGTSNCNFTVLIAGLNGFADSVSVSLSGLPAGTTTSPTTPFNVAAGSSQVVTLSIPSTAQS